MLTALGLFNCLRLNLHLKVLLCTAYSRKTRTKTKWKFVLL